MNDRMMTRGSQDLVKARGRLLVNRAWYFVTGYNIKYVHVRPNITEAYTICAIQKVPVISL